MASKNTIYLIRCNQSGLHKIGITGDWDRRRRELVVGSKTTSVRVVRVNDGRQLERWLHKRYKAVRLPQTEYFQLSADDLQHVLAALDKAANDHQQAVAKRHQAKGEGQAAGDPDRQRVIRRPEWERRVWTDKVFPEQVTEGDAKRSESRTGVPTGEESTADQVRRARAKQHAQQTDSYWAQAKPRKHVSSDQIAQSFKAWWLGLAAVFFLIVQSQPDANRLPPSERVAFTVVSGLLCGIAVLPAALFLSAATYRKKP
jgi:hypothetical protein